MKKVKPTETKQERREGNGNGQKKIPSIKPKPMNTDDEDMWQNKHNTSSDSETTREHGSRNKKKKRLSETMPVRRKKDTNNEEDMDIVEEWKTSFLEREQRKELGEKEYRILMAKQRRVKLKELTETTRNLQKQTHND